MNDVSVKATLVKMGRGAIFYLILGLLLSACLLPVCLLPACDRGFGESAPPELTISAASSLKESFEALARAFEEETDGAKVRLNFAGSQALRLQIAQGARIDVFACADVQHIDALVEERLVAESFTFARNDLAVVVPPKATLESFDALPQARRIVLGAPDVPIGRYSEEVLEKAASSLGQAFVDGVGQRVVSREANVRLVVSRITMNEADAAIVYRTDAVAMGERVRFIEIPESFNVEATYHLGTVADTPQTELARRFTTFVLGPTGQRILAEHGFLPAPPNPRP